MPADRLLHPRCGKSLKVSMLTDLEYRVWTQYLLSADDFGVMPMSTTKLKADNHHLERRPVKQLQRCLEALVACGLIAKFEHQGRAFVYQCDWQDWQKVTWPSRTDNPHPSDSAPMSAWTRLLFSVHPGAKKAPKKPDDSSSDVLQSTDEVLSPSRARERAERLTANEERPTANGSEGEWPAMDVLARELINLYPPEGRCGWNLVERPLFKALTDIRGDRNCGYSQAWDWLKDRLEQHKRSHQWRMKGMIKRLDRWLAEGLYNAEPAENPPIADQLTKSTTRTLAAVAEIMKEQP